MIKIKIVKIFSITNHTISQLSLKRAFKYPAKKIFNITNHTISQLSLKQYYTVKVLTIAFK